MPNPSFDLPDWPRAHGNSLFTGQIRQEPADFEVVEDLGWEPSGTGEHDFLWVEKTGQNTAWVATQLARHAGVPPRDVGYSGLKDRHAVTRQWFSVRRPTGRGTDWSEADVPGVAILDVRRHGKKLRRGVHRLNRFRIVVRHAGADRSALDERLDRVSSTGIPNYFGAQRHQRSIAISAARSYLFNEVLAERVRNETWNTGMPGDCFILEGTNSVFGPETLDEPIRDRLKAMDIHPAGPLWGDGEQRSSGAALELESRIIGRRGEWADGLSAVGAKIARRALRARVPELAGEVREQDVIFSFALGAGAYATSFLREFGATSA
jgi:tRNA pseudouridine13 synthase